MKTWIKWLVPTLVLGAVVYGGTIKTWSSAEALTAAAINANFQHIHNLMVGGHGARLVNSDVSASAAIASSKLASYRMIPRTWVLVENDGAGCDAGVYSIACQSVTGGSSSVAGLGVAGSYSVTLGYTASTSSDGGYSYAVITSAIGSYGGSPGSCYASQLAATSFSIVCRDLATPSPLAIGFSAVVYDDN